MNGISLTTTKKKTQLPENIWKRQIRNNKKNKKIQLLRVKLACGKCSRCGGTNTVFGPRLQTPRPAGGNYREVIYMS